MREMPRVVTLDVQSAWAANADAPPALLHLLETAAPKLKIATIRADTTSKQMWSGHMFARRMPKLERLTLSNWDLNDCEAFVLPAHSLTHLQGLA